MGKDKDRITVRLSEADLKGLNKIQASGDFGEMSAAVRFCIHFTISLMKVIPAALVASFSNTDADTEKEINKDDPLEKPTEEVPKQCNCENGNCKEM